MIDVQPIAMKLSRFPIWTALTLCCVAGFLTVGTGRAFAQSGTTATKPTALPPGLSKPEMPHLKVGALPVKPSSKPGLAGAPGTARSQPEDAPGGANSRRLPPPGVARGAVPPQGAAPSGNGGFPGGGNGGTGTAAKWQQPEVGGPPGMPTLSKDFINNCQRMNPNTRVHLDIYEEDLGNVVKLIACMTGKNIILSKDVKGAKITIYSPSPVNSSEAYRAFLSALEANGKTISESGKFLKIIDIKDYAHSPDPLRPQGTTPPNEDRMVTQIVPLKHVDAQDMNDVLSKMASANATFIVYAPSNSLIITELGSNLRKLLDLLKELDVPGGQEQLWVYQVQHAEANDIAQKIMDVFEQRDQGGGGGKRRPAAAPAPAKAAKGATAGGAPSTSSVGDSDQDVRVGKVIADERTNRLLIVATARSYRQIKDLIAKLDVSVEGDGQVHILQLSHAKASDLANTLSGLSQEAKARQGGKGGGGRGAKAPMPAGGAGAAGASPGGATGASLFEGDVKVTADEPTNSLVITSSFKDYLSLKKVIDLLDRPRRQVFLEAVVMEVSLSNDRQFGLGFHTPLGSPTIAGHGLGVVGKSSVGVANSLDLTSAANLQGLAVLAASKDKFTLAGQAVDIPAFGAVMHALAASSDANILSTPNILTTDNEEAEIQVGSNVPFVTQGGMGGLQALAGAAGGANAGLLGGLGGLGFSVQRQDVALTLKITPRINAANFVTMEVDQVVEEIEKIDPQFGPTTSKRSVKTTVIVKDQQTVVIGGLQKNVQNQSANKVPILGEIPIIGYLFRDNSSHTERRNLILMLTPHVIESQDDFRAIFKRKMEEHREFVARFHKEGNDFVVGIDYAKKNGALEAIHKAVVQAEEEQKLIEEVRKQTQGPPLPQDVDGVPLTDAAGPISVPKGEGGPAGPASVGGDVGGPSEITPIELPPPPEFEPPPPPDGGGEQ